MRPRSRMTLAGCCLPAHGAVAAAVVQDGVVGGQPGVGGQRVVDAARRGAGADGRAGLQRIDRPAGGRSHQGQQLQEPSHFQGARCHRQPALRSLRRCILLLQMSSRVVVRLCSLVTVANRAKTDEPIVNRFEI